MKYIKQFALFLVLAVVIGFIADSWRFSKLDDKQVSAQVLATLVQQLPAEQKNQFDQGEPLLVYLWATWCPFCKVTSGAVNNMFDEYPVASIALTSGSPSDVTAFQAESGHTFSFYNDHDGALTKALGLSVTPTFLIIDRTGEIQFMSVGMTTEISLRAKMAAFK